jgi:hypothetical protein
MRESQEHKSALGTDSGASEVPPSTDELREKISAQYNIQFEFPARKIEPADYDLSMANDMVVEGLGKILLEYVQLPKINYVGIKDHSERRALGKTVEQKFGPPASTLLQNDKFKGNKLSAIEAFIQLLTQTYKGSSLPPELKEKIEDIIPQFPTRGEIQQYGTMGAEQQAVLVAEMDAAALDFLELFRKVPKVKTAGAGV